MISEFTFNGYTKYWQDHYTRQVRYGNLIRFDVPDIDKTILQSKINIAEDIGLPGLQMQEGFLSSLLDLPHKVLEDPDISRLESELSENNVLVYADTTTQTGRYLIELTGIDIFPFPISAHQYDSPDLSVIKAFALERGDRKLWVVITSDVDSRSRIKSLIQNVDEVVHQYDLYKGWFGVQTLLKSVTATPGHPIEVIGKGMNEGVSWFVFSGYMEFLAKEEIAQWVKQVDLPVVTDVGFSPVYGCRDYEGLQVQTMWDSNSWIEFADDKSCFSFRSVFDPEADSMGFVFDGYRASIGNKLQIDIEEVPFVLHTGNLLSGTIPSMILFIQKEDSLDRESMWQAILDRRAVGVADMGQMMGPETFRKALGLLTLDRVFLEEYFKDELLLEAKVRNYNLVLDIKNNTSEVIAGDLELSLPPGLSTSRAGLPQVSLDPGQEKQFEIELQPTKESMGYSNPIGVTFQSPEVTKTTAALLELPPVITAPPVSFGHTEGLAFPVTIHNYTKVTTFPVLVEVFQNGNTENPVWSETKISTVAMANFETISFEPELPAGDYQIQTTALDATLETQLGVREGTGTPTLEQIDLNKDGIDEYVLENDSVRVTLLSTGARVIEYLVKSRQDNVLFKLWPDKPSDDRMPFRRRGFYPFGGFEDFLGQPSIETHKVYRTEIVPTTTHQVSVRMVADYFGSTIQKTFTLYGNSPLLEIGFSVTMNHPELNVIGPQPIVELGKVHGPEDVFILPEIGGNKEYRMMPERYYGRIAYLREGWNAGWDSEEDVALVGAYPVDLPLFLHMWMNHPSNRDAHYYYAEFQPWIPIPRHSTLHMNYYMWGAGGSWEDGVKELRSRNLIESTRKSKL